MVTITNFEEKLKFDCPEKLSFIVKVKHLLVFIYLLLIGFILTDLLFFI